MNIQQMTSEDLELRLIELLEHHSRLCIPGFRAHTDGVWMIDAVKELQLRRLARSAG